MILEDNSDENSAKSQPSRGNIECADIRIAIHKNPHGRRWNASAVMVVSGERLSYDLLVIRLMPGNRDDLEFF